jgi:hypothetical protein
MLPPGAAPPAPSPISPSPAPMPTADCVTPDPFATLGGGTCFNGGWLPPGMPPPGGTPALQPPSPPPTEGGCLTPDPFITLSNLIGSCVNGGWIPVPGVHDTGTVRYFAIGSGIWALDVEVGYWDVPITYELIGLPPAYQIDGLRVFVSGKVRYDVVFLGGLAVEISQISVQ